MGIDRTFDGTQLEYDPAAIGFEVIGRVEVEPDYDFNIFLVVRDTESGLIYYVDDAGCSCPSPFEDHNSLSALTLASDYAQVERAVTGWNSGYRPVRTEEIQRLLDAVRAVLP